MFQKGAAIDRILGEIVHSKCMTTPIDYVLCIGHFLGKDEDIYTFFEPELPSDREGNGVGRAVDIKPPAERRAVAPRTFPAKGTAKPARAKSLPFSADRKGWQSRNCNRMPDDNSGLHEGSSVLDMKGENYFSCAVGRKRSNARYSLKSSDEAVYFLRAMAASYSETTSVLQRNGWRAQKRASKLS